MIVRFGRVALFFERLRLILLTVVAVVACAVTSAKDVAADEGVGGCDLETRSHGVCVGNAYGPRTLGDDTEVLMHEGSVERKPQTVVIDDEASKGSQLGALAIERAVSLSEERGHLVACSGDLCYRDNSTREVGFYDVHDWSGKEVGGADDHGAMIHQNLIEGGEDGSAGSLVSFLALSTAQMPGSAGGTGAASSGAPTAVFEVGRFRLPKSPPGKYAVEQTIVFQNKNFEERMAPVVVCQVANVRGGAEIPMPPMTAQLLAVSHQGFLVEVASSFRDEQFDEDLSLKADVMWFAYGFSKKVET